MPTIADTFIAELEQETAATRRVLERIPGEKFDWKPHVKSFSLGELAYHVATIPRGVSGMVAPDEFDVSTMKHPKPGPPSELLTTLDASVAAAKESLAAIDDERMMAIWKVIREGQTMLELPRVAAIRAILLNHWYHHRGQLSVYLRLLDVPVPAVYGNSADENPLE